MEAFQPTRYQILHTRVLSICVVEVSTARLFDLMTWLLHDKQGLNPYSWKKESRDILDETWNVAEAIVLTFYYSMYVQSL